MARVTIILDDGDERYTVERETAWHELRLGDKPNNGALIDAAVATLKRAACITSQ